MLDEVVSPAGSLGGNLEPQFSGDGIQCRQPSLGGVDNASAASLAEGLPQKQASKSDRGSSDASLITFSHDLTPMRQFLLPRS